MAAGRADLVIDQGEDFTAQIYWTNYFDEPFPVVPPMRMHIRSSLGQTVADLYVPDTPAPDGTINPIEYNQSTGWVQLHIPESQTSTMPAGVYQYDLFVHVDAGDYQVAGQTQDFYQSVRLLWGQVSVNQRITPAS